MHLWPLLAAVLFSCKHVPSDKDRQSAQIHYDLGVQVQVKDVQQAFLEYEKALALDPDFPEAHNAVGVLYHLAFGRHDEAIVHYRRALEIRPTFSEAKTNLANVYLDLKRYDDAIGLYEQALNDMLYPTPYIAQSNLGWALYKKGDSARAIEAIRAAITTNPKFCLGLKNLGSIYEDQGQLDDACRYYGRYKEQCPDVADAHYRDGRCKAKQGDLAAARQSFQTCEAKAASEAERDDCRQAGEQVGP